MTYIPRGGPQSTERAIGEYGGATLFRQRFTGSSLTAGSITLRTGVATLVRFGGYIKDDSNRKLASNAFYTGVDWFMFVSDNGAVGAGDHLKVFVGGSAVDNNAYDLWAEFTKV